ncbi:MAG: hypothetical protein FJ247_14380, partial [Nitrospira sp.]|nr:hypothetical protein [Nitrospira sp.]
MMTAPELVIAPSSHDYGTLLAGEESSQAFTLTNIGMSDLVVEEIFTEGDYYSVSGGGRPNGGAFLHFDLNPEININDYALSRFDAGFLPVTDLTIEFWFRSSGDGGLFTATDSDPDHQNYDRSIGIVNGRLVQYVAIAAGVPRTLQSESVVSDGEWHHVAMVMHRNGVQEMFVDGRLEASGAGGVSYYDWADRVLFGGNRPFGSFTGDMDEARIWSVPLTGDQIRAGMNASLAGDEEGLIAYWRMDEGAGQWVADDSPNDHPLRLGMTEDAEDPDPVWNGGRVGGITLGSNESVDITVTFHPAAAGDYPGRLVAVSNDPRGDQSADLMGRAVWFGVIEV